MKGLFYDKSLAGVYEAIGGIEAFRRISARFHHKIEEDPILRGFFPKNMAELEERLALYLAERTGGESEYTSARGKTSLFCRHAHLAIGTTEATHWLEHMRNSLLEEGVEETTATQVMANLTDLAATLADPFVGLYHLPIAQLRERLVKEPSLALANDRGRNLIGAAAIAWDVPRLRLLLEFGADVEAKDVGGHNPLYRVANGVGNEEEGREAILLLVEAGARVNQVTGIGGMTPLHMSARRGTTKIAETLLDLGADIEARDKKGETPLRRAVNCGRFEIVRLLISRGADPMSRDNKGQTVLSVARDTKIREVLVSMG